MSHSHISDQALFDIARPSSSFTSLERLLAAEVAHLRTFKKTVHTLLDQHGVPIDDPTNVRSQEGCRVGARLEWLFAQHKKMVDLYASMVAVKEKVFVPAHDKDNVDEAKRERSEKENKPGESFTFITGMTVEHHLLRTVGQPAIAGVARGQLQIDGECHSPTLPLAMEKSASYRPHGKITMDKGVYNSTGDILLTPGEVIALIVFLEAVEARLQIERSGSRLVPGVSAVPTELNAAKGSPPPTLCQLMAVYNGEQRRMQVNVVPPGYNVPHPNLGCATFTVLIDAGVSHDTQVAVLEVLREVLR